MPSYTRSLHNSIPDKTPSPAHLFPGLPILTPADPSRNTVVLCGSPATALEGKTQEVK